MAVSFDDHPVAVQLEQSDAPGGQDGKESDGGEEVQLFLLEPIPQAVGEGEEQGDHQSPLLPQPSLIAEFGQDDGGNDDVAANVDERVFPFIGHERVSPGGKCFSRGS